MSVSSKTTSSTDWCDPLTTTQGREERREDVGLVDGKDGTRVEVPFLVYDPPGQ